jgi:hypothetical protein
MKMLSSFSSGAARLWERARGLFGGGARDISMPRPDADLRREMDGIRAEASRSALQFDERIGQPQAPPATEPNSVLQQGGAATSSALLQGTIFRTPIDRQAIDTGPSAPLDYEPFQTPSVIVTAQQFGNLGLGLGSHLRSIAERLDRLLRAEALRVTRSNSGTDFSEHQWRLQSLDSDQLILHCRRSSQRDEE